MSLRSAGHASRVLRFAAACGIALGAALQLDSAHAESDASRPSTPARPAPTRIELDTAVLDVRFDPEDFELPKQVLLDWIAASGRAVERYYAGFPVENVRIQLIPSPGKGVITGRTEAWNGARVRVQVGARTDRRDLERDWIMVHELVHLAFPSVPNRHHWIEEGLATYVEPLARLEAGEVPPETVWHDLLDGLPKGLPRAGDRGLDFTPTWGRTYWGGALFCFLAELEIRKETDNRKGLRDALRAITREGGNMSVRWPLSKALEIGDREIGAPILTNLYARMRADPAPVDLDALFTELGVERQGREIRFREDAPLAATRQAIAPEVPARRDRGAPTPRKFDP